jgi:osmotically-inducible protein OsmY
MKQNMLSVLVGLVVVIGVSGGGSVAAEAASPSAAVSHIKADQWMRWKIDARLQNDPYLDYRGVKAIIKQNGVVVLTGYVFTDYEKDHAAQVASAVPGINDVKNEIKVVQFTAGHDGAVAQQVRSQIIQDPTMNVTALEVVAEKNGVILHGIVPTAELKARIGQFASEVQGVKHVVNDIDVEAGQP